MLAEKIKSHGEKNGYVIADWQESDTLRFVHAANFNLEKAFKEIVKHFEWCKATKPVEISANVNSILRSSGAFYVYGKDYKFRPNIYVSGKVIEALLSKGSSQIQEDIKKSVIYFIDYVISNLLIPGQVENCNIIVNLTKTRQFKMNPFVSSLIKSLQSNYKYYVNCFYIYGLIKFFQSSFFEPFNNLDPLDSNRINRKNTRCVLVDSIKDLVGSLDKVISKGQREKMYGGNRENKTCDFFPPENLAVNETIEVIEDSRDLNPSSSKPSRTPSNSYSSVLLESAKSNVDSMSNTKRRSIRLSADLPAIDLISEEEFISKFNNGELSYEPEGDIISSIKNRIGSRSNSRRNVVDFMDAKSEKGSVIHEETEEQCSIDLKQTAAIKNSIQICDLSKSKQKTKSNENLEDFTKLQENGSDSKQENPDDKIIIMSNISKISQFTLNMDKEVTEFHVNDIVNMNGAQLKNHSTNFDDLDDSVHADIEDENISIEARSKLHLSPINPRMNIQKPSSSNVDQLRRIHLSNDCGGFDLKPMRLDFSNLDNKDFVKGEERKDFVECKGSMLIKKRLVSRSIDFFKEESEFYLSGERELDQIDYHDNKGKCLIY